MCSAANLWTARRFPMTVTRFGFETASGWICCAGWRILSLRWMVPIPSRARVHPCRTIARNDSSRVRDMTGSTSTVVMPPGEGRTLRLREDAARPNTAHSHVDRALRVDVVWNLVSYAVVGLCGLALNVLIGRFYDAATLGTFNQVFAAYILFSQFAVGGIHYSALKAMAEHAQDRSVWGAILLGALIPAGLLSLGFAAGFFVSRTAIGAILDSPDVSVGIAWATPGLFFFAVNKVLLGAVNGLRWMKWFAILQALRPILLIAGLVGLTAIQADPSSLPLIFSMTELVILVLSAIPFLPACCARTPGLGFWISSHVSFGTRSILSGVLTELNTRVDVLLLGYFSTDRVVGIY